MTQVIDIRFEQAMCDHWWVQDNAKIVRRPEIEYLTSHKNNGFVQCRRSNVDPEYKDTNGLIEEFLQAHEGKESAWRIGAPSYTSTLDNLL